jgi:hypothetical protein
MDEGVWCFMLGLQQYASIHCTSLTKMQWDGEWLIQTIKHGLIVFSSMHIQGWDVQIPRILFEYHCGVWANTRYSPYMVLIRHNPRLIVDNNLNGLCDVVDE